MPDTEAFSITAGTRIAVTGGAGFIGSHLVARLVESGAVVLVLDDLSTGEAAAVPPITEVHAVDVRTPGARRSVSRFRPDVVVHLAAHSDAADPMRSPLQDADIIVRGTVNMLEASADANARFIFASTCAVYGDVDKQPVREDQAATPATPYAMSKAAALGYVGWFVRHRGLAATSLMLGSVYGPGQQAGVVSEFVDAAMSGRPAMIEGHERQSRDFVHVADVSEAFARACARPSAGIINIGSGAETTIHTLHGLVTRAAGTCVVARYRDSATSEIARMRLAVDRARDLLNWQPTVTLADGLRALVTQRAARAVAV